MDTNAQKFPVGTRVFTPQGAGKVVYCLPDGTILVQFHYGGGKVYRAGELFSSQGVRPSRRALVTGDPQWLQHAA
jgi:hypothetical protein